jgi:hypothetical protein
LKFYTGEKATLILRVKICAPLNLQPKSTIFTVKYIVFPISLYYAARMVKKILKQTMFAFVLFRAKQYKLESDDS